MGISETDRGTKTDGRDSNSKAWKRFPVRLTPFAVTVSLFAFLLFVRVIISSVYLQADIDKKEFSAPDIVMAQEGDSDELSLEDLESLQRKLRQRELSLNRREDELDEREAELTPLEKEVNSRLAQLEEIESRLTLEAKKWADMADVQTNEKLAHLVALYTAMEPDQAAVIMNKLNVDTALFILQNMSGKSAGAVLALMQTEKSAIISEELSKLKN